MNYARGYLRIDDPDSGVREAETFTCAHCQYITICDGKDAKGLGGYCHQCDALVCERCAGKDCVPFLRKVEAMEEQYYRRRQEAL